MSKLYGHGTITELVKGKKYYLDLPCGKNPITKKYDKMRETFLGTKTEARHRLEEMRAEYENGIRPNADKITYAELSEEFLGQRERAGKLRTATIARDKAISKHLLESLGKMKVCDISPAHINTLYDDMRKRHVGGSTISACHKQLKQILRYAVNTDVILRNPCDRVEAPKRPDTDRQALSVSEAQRLSNLLVMAVLEAPKIAVLLGLSTGMRLGEVLGLTWRLVDLQSERPSLYIAQQLTRDGTLSKPKTASSVRLIPLDTTTAEILKKWKAKQAAYFEALNGDTENRKGRIKQTEDTLVCTNKLGSAMDQSDFERWFHNFCVENGFGDWFDERGKKIVRRVYGVDPADVSSDAAISWVDSEGWPVDDNGHRYSRSNPRPKVHKHYNGLKFHELRHTHFTLRIANGVDLKTVQALGGWSSPELPLKVYSHPVSENIWASATFMDDLSNSPKTNL